MKSFKILFFVTPVLVLLSACASVKYQWACARYDYKDRWLQISSADTNTIPSGMHLLRGKIRISNVVSNYVAEKGLPDYVRQPRNSTFSFELLYSDKHELVRVYAYDDAPSLYNTTVIKDDYLLDAEKQSGGSRVKSEGAEN